MDGNFFINPGGDSGDARYAIVVSVNGKPCEITADWVARMIDLEQTYRQDLAVASRAVERERDKIRRLFDVLKDEVLK